MTHSTLMDGLYESGNCGKAADIRDEMLKAGLQPDIISYNIVFKGLCSCNRTSEAVDLLDEALKNGIIPTNITWSILVKATFNSEVIQTSSACEL